MNHQSNVILNTITLLLTIGVNTWAGIYGVGGNTVGDISARYETLITPAGYAFSIWSVIYIGLVAFVGYQWYEIKRRLPVTSDAGTWLIWANVANSMWLYAWLNEYLWLSVVMMFILLDFLIRIAFRLNLEVWDAPLRVIVFVWWPFTIYIGWIVLASVTNVAAYLVSLEWIFAPEAMAVVMIGVATLVYLLLTYFRKMRETCFVGIWGLIAIVVKQGEAYPMIRYAVIVACVVLLVVAVIQGYKNRATSPLMKWKRGEV